MISKGINYQSELLSPWSSLFLRKALCCIFQIKESFDIIHGESVQTQDVATQEDINQYWSFGILWFLRINCQHWYQYQENNTTGMLVLITDELSMAIIATGSMTAEMVIWNRRIWLAVDVSINWMIGIAPYLWYVRVILRRGKTGSGVWVPFYPPGRHWRTYFQNSLFPVYCSLSKNRYRSFCHLSKCFWNGIWVSLYPPGSHWSTSLRCDWFSLAALPRGFIATF